MIYIIICKFGDHPYIAERPLADCGYERTLQDLMDNNFPDIRHVIHADYIAGTSADVSAPIASELLRIAIGRFDKFQPDDGRLAFIEEHLGCRRANAVRA